MVVLHIAPLDWSRLSGVVTAARGMMEAQHASRRCQVAFLNSAKTSGDCPNLPFPVFDCRSLGRSEGVSGLPSPFCRPEVVVFHNTYVPLHWQVARQLRRNSIPYVICPHGGLTRLAQDQRRWKKSLANLLFFRRMLRGAAAIHCNTESDAKDARRWGRPIFVVGSGVSIPAASYFASPGSAAKRRIVFLGRLAIQHKGLDLLVKACELASRQLQEGNTVVELVGPDFRGGREYLESEISRARLQSVVSLIGPKTGADKAAALGQADAFVHTSRWEGHPNAVLEAMSHGLPCLLTPGTNIADDVEKNNAGWRVGPTPEAIAEGLARIARLEPAALKDAGEAAQQFVSEQCSWSAAAETTIAYYRRFAA